jgi:hypothetical protein
MGAEGITPSVADVLDEAALHLVTTPVRIRDALERGDLVAVGEELSGVLIARFRASVLTREVGPVARSTRLSASPVAGPLAGPPPPVRACFPAGTMVLTSAGLTAIEDVLVGDPVWAHDAESDAWGWHEVSATFEHEHDGELRVLTLEGETLTATANHPICVIDGEGLLDRPAALAAGGCAQGGRWLEAGAIVPGDVLATASGAATVHGAAGHLESTAVFNLEVSGASTYAVTEAGVLVHNKAAANPRRPWLITAERTDKVASHKVWGGLQPARQHRPLVGQGHRKPRWIGLEGVSRTALRAGMDGGRRQIW